MKYLFPVLAFVIAVGVHAQTSFPPVFSEREQARIVDDILEDRLDNLLPELMRREGIDMWIIISREYNEDPVMETMLPSTWLRARRRTIMVFYDPGGEEPLEKIAIARYDVGRLLKGAWNLDVYPEQWEALVETIRDRDPHRIGLNISKFYGLADGLVHTEHEEFMAKLPDMYKDRIVSAEKLAVSWLETRSTWELEIYPMVCRLGHAILQEGLSEKVIHPGITTTDDVVWWLRQRVIDLGLKTWFHPTVSIQRDDDDKTGFLRNFSRRPEEQVIRHGDLLHVDFGITYLKINTDQQQHFYVLKPGENEVPASLQEGYRRSSRLQDILTSNFELGRTGNEILALSLAQAKEEGIVTSIYTHPIGLHGHGAGVTIGMWDKQKGVAGTGDWPLHKNTAFSIELNSSSEIGEWGKIVRFMLEENGYYDGENFLYFDGRQKKIATIPRMPGRQ
jgi:Xaa-Pro aminopeptidase